MMLFIPPILALIFSSTFVTVGDAHSCTVDACTHWVMIPTFTSPTFLTGPKEKDRNEKIVSLHYVGKGRRNKESRNIRTVMMGILSLENINY